MAKNNDAATSENEKKRELEQSLAQAQNPLKSIRQDRETDLELNQNFFEGNNVDHEQKVILKKTIEKHSNKNYSPTQVKSRNFLTKISFNRLKSVDFVNASFIIDCYTYILFNLNPVFCRTKIRR